ncbi:MAG TPA: Rieske (2Fe-2S) protein, partial [Puia sp.]|nr:Rieske (2Fe-2S) protein [Puia sp.]
MNKNESEQDQPSRPEDGLTRKGFLTRISLSIAGISAAVMAVPVISALVAPLLESNEALWRPVGRVDEFPVGGTRLVSFENADSENYAGVLAKSAAWLRRIDRNRFIAFAVNCSHLGCPVRWEESAQLFMCPCHGGVYYRDGSVAAGPPPKRLTEYKVRVRNGVVELQTAPLPITSI